MGPVSIGFGIAAGLTVAVSLIRGRRHPSFRLSVMLLLFWGIANLTDPWIDPWMDAAGFYVAAGAWILMERDGERTWALILAVLFLAQMLIHLLYSGAPLSHSRFLALNVLYAAQLISAAWPGASHGLRHLRRRRVHRGSARPLGGMARLD